MVVGPWNLRYGSGVVLDGSSGPLLNAYGLPMDYVISFTVVTADGDIKTVTPTHNEELFWAVKGAGALNFGVITSFTLELFQTPLYNQVQGNPSHLFYYTLERCWPLESANTILSHWGKLFDNTTSKSKTDDSAPVMNRALVAKIDINKHGVSLHNLYLGPKDKGASACTVFDVPSVSPVLQRQSSSPSIHQWVHRICLEDSAMQILTRSAIVNALDSSTLDAVTAVIKNASTLSKSPYDFWNINLEFIFGAVTEYSSSHCAFPHRTKSVQITCSAHYRQDDSKWTKWVQLLDNAKSKFIGVSPALVDTSPYNASDSLVWGDNLSLLQDIKKAHDPDRVFSNPQGVSQ